ncbi:MAG: hypothetical protein IPO71_13560 [Nitrosomonas sp.]|nr:hypothetical protein [Nitrosomonas sp.]
MNIARIGIDLAKQVFQIHGVDRTEKVGTQALRRSRWLFQQTDAMPDGMKHAVLLGARTGQMGHEVRLMAPQGNLTSRAARTTPMMQRRSKLGPTAFCPIRRPSSRYSGGTPSAHQSRRVKQ